MHPVEEPDMTTAPGPGLERIGQIAVTVKDLKRAIAFYRDTLDLKLLFEVAPKMAFFDCGGVRLMLALPETPEFDHPASILYYRVPDIRAAYDTLNARGVVFEAGPELVAPLAAADLWMAFAHDSEGNLFALMSEVPRG
jgi:predicted enzyme related to lactoylglutathione lyase